MRLKSEYFLFKIEKNICATDVANRSTVFDRYGAAKRIILTELKRNDI